MGLEEILDVNEVLNNTNVGVLDFLPPDIVSQIGSLITILKITGIVIISYIAFLIIKWIFGVKKYRKINKIYEMVKEMDRKLNFLIKKKKVKGEEVEEFEDKKKKKEILIKKLFAWNDEKRKEKKK